MVLTVPMLLATLALTYLVSRLMLRVPVFPANQIGRLQAHAASTVILVLLDMLLKYSIGAFMYDSPLLVLACQLVWLWYDSKRQRLPGAV